mmetsp:Transcript_81247/g.217176  ORF Transcript_81247/g.217176 Transcript_81247/m.217176 type:complete len:271 (+) Transcript_81247:1700-2512(+)
MRASLWRQIRPRTVFWMHTTYTDRSTLKARRCSIIRAKDCSLGMAKFSLRRSVRLHILMRTKAWIFVAAMCRSLSCRICRNLLPLASSTNARYRSLSTSAMAQRFRKKLWIGTGPRCMMNTMRREATWARTTLAIFSAATCRSWRRLLLRWRRATAVIREADACMAKRWARPLRQRTSRPRRACRICILLYCWRAAKPRQMACKCTAASCFLASNATNSRRRACFWMRMAADTFLDSCTRWRTPRQTRCTTSAAASRVASWRRALSLRQD